MTNYSMSDSSGCALYLDNTETPRRFVESACLQAQRQESSACTKLCLIYSRHSDKLDGLMKSFIIVEAQVLLAVGASTVKFTA